MLVSPGCHEVRAMSLPIAVGGGGWQLVPGDVPKPCVTSLRSKLGTGTSNVDKRKKKKRSHDALRNVCKVRKCCCTSAKCQVEI